MLSKYAYLTETNTVNVATWEGRSPSDIVGRHMGSVFSHGDRVYFIRGMTYTDVFTVHAVDRYTCKVQTYVDKLPYAPKNIISANNRACYGLIYEKSEVLRWKLDSADKPSRIFIDGFSSLTTQHMNQRVEYASVDLTDLTLALTKWEFAYLYDLTDCRISRKYDQRFQHTELGWPNCLWATLKSKLVMCDTREQQHTRVKVDGWAKGDVLVSFTIGMNSYTVDLCIQLAGEDGEESTRWSPHNAMLDIRNMAVFVAGAGNLPDHAACWL